MDKEILMTTGKVNLGPVDQIALGHGRCFIIDGQEIAVFRPRNGGVFAMANRCPHAQGPLAEGVMGDGKVVCPLHGHKFDITSGQGSEAHECVKVFKVREENRDIVIILDGSMASITSVK
jgi:nitrite reductase (NADH) small subunit